MLCASTQSRDCLLQVYVVSILIVRAIEILVAVALDALFLELFSFSSRFVTTAFFLSLCIHLCTRRRSKRVRRLTFKWLLPLMIGIDLTSNVALIYLTFKNPNINSNAVVPERFTQPIRYAIGTYWIHVLPFTNNIALGFVFARETFGYVYYGTFLYRIYYFLGSTLLLFFPYLLFFDITFIYGFTFNGALEQVLVCLGLLVSSALASGLLYVTNVAALSDKSPRPHRST